MMPFDEMPRLEGERLLLREMDAHDAPVLERLTHSEAVYRYLPTFLYELKYEDKALVISRMREECFDTKESILLAICLRDAPDDMVGIAEIYGLEERKPKVSIGYRIHEDWWHSGIAKETVRLLKDYLIERTTTRTITAHVMPANEFSGRALEHNGFVRLFSGVSEDWGFAEPVLVDKYVFKRRWLTGGPDAPR